MRTRLESWFQVFTLALLLISPLPSFATNRSPVIIHSNDVLGEIEPCGCRSNPTGGMIRKNILLKKHPLLANRQKHELLQLDAGDLFFSTNEIPEALVPQTKIQALALAKTLKLTGLRALVPGEKDFALGIDFFQKLVRESGATALAANLELRKKKSWSPWPYASKTFELRSSQETPHRVSVLGIMGQSISVPKNIRVREPSEVIRNWITEHRKKSDWLILLSHQGFDEDLKTAETFSEIDFVIGAHSQSFLQNPRILEKNGKVTSIHQGSFRNQVVGLIELRAPFQSELIPLDSSFDPDPSEKADLVQRIVDETKAAINEENKRAEAKLLAYTKQIGKSGVDKFQTLSKCADCHLKQFNFWRKTPHAQAYETLVKAGSHQNLECLSCHSVGLNDPQGFSKIHQLVKWIEQKKQAPNLENWLQEIRSSDEKKTPALLSQIDRTFATVQCENCHGPGQDHPFQLQPMKRINTSQCLGCHTPDRAPQWYESTQGKMVLKEQLAAQKLKQMGCPLGTE